MYKDTVSRTRSKKLLLTLLSLILLVLVVFVVLELTGKTSLFKKNVPEQANADNEAQTTSNQPSAQANFTNGDNREPGNTVQENQGTANIVDNNGQEATDKSNPIVSSSGEITVFLPNKDSLVKTGQEVSGVSNLPTIFYRLLDDQSGVIATGELSVVNGNFSGTLSFTTQANEGRLDIFGRRQDATEFSNIEIPLRFK